MSEYYKQKTEKRQEREQRYRSLIVEQQPCTNNYSYTSENIPKIDTSFKQQDYSSIEELQLPLPASEPIDTLDIEFELQTFFGDSIQDIRPTVSAPSQEDTKEQEFVLGVPHTVNMDQSASQTMSSQSPHCSNATVPSPEPTASNLEENQTPVPPTISAKPMYRGKNINMFRTENAIEEETDYETEVEEVNEGEHVEEDISPKEIEEIIKGKQLLSYDELIIQINELKSAVNCEYDKNLKDKITLLKGLGSYVDHKTKTTTLTKGIVKLFKDGIPNMEHLLGTLSKNSDILISYIPEGLKWLMIHICLSYNCYFESRKKSKKILCRELTILMFDLREDDFNPISVIYNIIKFQNELLKICRNEKSVGDKIIDVDPSDGEVTADVFIKPTRPSKRKLTPRQAAYASSEDSDTASEASSSKRRYTGLSNLQKVAKDYPPSPRYLCLRRDDSSSPSGISPSANYGLEKTREERQRSSGKNVSFDISNPSIGVAKTQETLDMSKIHINTSLKVNHTTDIINPIYAVKPNVHVNLATKDIIKNIITTGTQEPGTAFDFTEITKQFVERVTTNVYGEAITNQTEIVNRLPSSEGTDKSRYDAIKICISSLPILYCQYDSTVSVSWDFLKEWGMAYSQILSEVSLLVLNNRQSQGRTDSEDYKDDYFIFKSEIENKINRLYSPLLEKFKKLSEIDDTCLYILFGINIVEDKKNKQYTYTDLLVRNILLTWKLTKECPPDLSKSHDEEKLKYISWCLPLAYFMNWREVNKSKKVVNERVQCDFDDFMAVC